MRSILTRVAAIAAIVAIGIVVSLAANLRDLAVTTINGDAGPKIVLPTTHYDFGSVSADAPLQACFHIHNAGGRRLILRGEDATCCNPASRDSIIVEPNCTAEIPVIIEDVAPHAQFQRKLAYLTNDQAMPHFEITISANIKRPTAAPE